MSAAERGRDSEETLHDDYEKTGGEDPPPIAANIPRGRERRRRDGSTSKSSDAEKGRLHYRGKGEKGKGGESFLFDLLAHSQRGKTEFRYTLRVRIELRKRKEKRKRGGGRSEFFSLL